MTPILAEFLAKHFLRYESSIFIFCSTYFLTIYEYSKRFRAYRNSSIHTVENIVFFKL